MQHLGNADWVRVFRTWCLEPLIPVENGGDTDVTERNAALKQWTMACPQVLLLAW